jgi:hypothetical protein
MFEVAHQDTTIIAQLAFAAVLFAISGICLFAPQVIQRLAVKQCPRFVRSYVEADFYRVHVRICGCVALLMAALMLYATFWATAD